MKDEEKATLPPEQQLRLFLIENDYPYADIPTLLRYCPQLIHKYSVEELAMVALSNINLFEPQKLTFYVRPFVYESFKAELGKFAKLHEHIEEALSIFSQDTMIETMTDLIADRRKVLRDGK